MKFISGTLLLMIMMACQSNKTQSVIQTNEILNTDQSQISYSDCGQGKITLLFVHGWNINKSYWSQQQERFCDDYRVITLDLPGFGNSKNLIGDYSMTSYGKDVSMLIEQLGLRNVVLIGHSMGGRVILETAQANDRVIALVGVDNFKEVSQQMTDELMAEVNGFMDWLKVDFVTNSPAYADQHLIHSETDSSVRRRILHDYGNVNKESAISAIEAYLSYEFQEKDQLSKLNIPLYLISSDMSPVDTIGLKSTGLDSKVYEMNQTGHFPMVEQPEIFNEYLSNALIEIMQTIEN